MLYQELLSFSNLRYMEFFKNVPLFENQFKWDDFNEECYKRMYTLNSYENFATVKDLKILIPELKDTCKKCGNYFIPARNKSIPKYDVILGKEHEEVLMEFLSEKLDTSIIRGDLENRKYPDCKIMKKDGSIAAYFEVKFHGAPFVSAINMTGRYCYEGSATLDYDKIEKQLQIVENEINVPVYYVHWLEYPCLKGVFYENAADVKNYINSQHQDFERKKREGDLLKTKAHRYYKKMYSQLLELKSFDDLLLELKSLL